MTPGARTLLLLAMLTVLSACQREQVQSGRVVDFDSGKPLSGAMVTARQSGWGISNGSLVWDKSYDYRAFSDYEGHFELHYAHGPTAHLWVEAQGYQRLELWSEPGDELSLPLKPLVADYRPLTSGHLVLGQYRDGRFYGWKFSACRQMSDPSEADLIPIEMEPDSRGRMVLQAGGSGGLLCQSFSELDAPAQPLTYGEMAPLDGYRSQAVLDFTEDEGGVCFVRTRDGGHYAKFAYTPKSFGSRTHPMLQRDVLLRFVYNPDGGRELQFQEEGPNPSCGDPWAMP